MIRILLNPKILIGVIIIIGLLAGVYLVQRQTTLKSKASQTTGPARGSFVSEMGIQIDTGEAIKTPSKDIYNVLNPKWVRFVYRPNKGIPSNIPSSVNVLLIFNHESAQGAPIGKIKDVEAWNRYTDDNYLPVLENLLSKNLNIKAVEIWNEQDVCPSLKEYCPEVPAQSYAYMLKKAAEKIKSHNKNIDVVVGGFAAGTADYLNSMKNAEPNVLAQVDGVGLHPYDKSPDGWCATDSTECKGILLSDDLGKKIQDYKTAANNLPIWVTEIGYGTPDEVWQAEFLVKSFQVLSNSNVPVVIWYAWTDTMLGGNNQSNWGLLDDEFTVKASGIEFQLLNDK